jgi:hypothetical protein
MPGQNSVVAEHYPDHFHTVSFPIHGSTIARNGITPLLYVEKRQIVIDDVRLITRRAGASGLTLDVGFTPGATPVATWKGTITTTLSSATVTIASTTSGYSASSLSVGDRLYAIAGGVPTGVPAEAYITAVASDFSTVTMNTGTGATAATGTTAYVVSYKSVLTAPMDAATENTIVVGAINSNQSTLPTAAPNNLEVTEPNNVVPGPTTSGSTTTLGRVLCIEARGAATTDYVGTLQIRYRERLA